MVAAAAPGRAGYRGLPAPPRGKRLGAQDQPTGSLVEARRQRPVAHPDGGLIDHPPSGLDGRPDVNLFRHSS
jgi:hypothetical protein